MLLPTTFISASEKIGVGLKKKQVANFYFNFTRRKVLRYSCFVFFSFFFQCKMRVFSSIWTMKYLTFQIRCTATYVNVEIHKMLNFPKICSIYWNICADLQSRLPQGINPYRDNKAYTSQSNFYGSKMKLLYQYAQLRASNICKHGISKPCWHMLSQLQNLSWCSIVYM